MYSKHHRPWVIRVKGGLLCNGVPTLNYSPRVAMHNTGMAEEAQPGIFGRILRTARAGAVVGVLACATATNVGLALTIHSLTLNRKRAQGRSIYAAVAVYSWALRLLWWIKVRVKAVSVPQLEQFVLSCNHISFLDLFLICHGVYQALPRKSIENIRVIYWAALDKVPVLRWVFFLCGGIPIKMLGGTSLNAENVYDKDSVKQMYAEVERAVLQDKRSIALSFEGRRNPTPHKLSKIQKGMFRISTAYKLPILLLRLDNVEKIWPAEGYPCGSGEVEVEVLGQAYRWETVEEYEKGLRDIYES